MRLLLQQPRSDVVFVLDRDNKVRFVNRLSPETRVEDFVGSTGIYRLMPGCQALAAEAVSRTRATGKVQIVEVQTVDGRWWQARTTLIPGHDPKLEHVLVICTDCTELKLAEEALRRSEERFDLAVRGSDAGVWDWNMVTGQTWYSPRCRSMLGYDDQEDFEGNHHAWNERIHPDDRKRDRAALRAHLAGETPYYESQYRVRHKDGSYRWILARGMGVFDAQGKAIRIVGSHIDITAWKQAQEAVQAKQQMLRRLLDVYEAHRKLAAYEIHDGLAQPLAGALMSIEAFGQGRCDGGNIDWREYDRAVHLLRQSLAEARRLMSGLRPALLDELGVLAAVESLVAEVEGRGRLHVELVCSVQFQRLAAPLETAIFRIAQESLINAERHSQSSKAAVCLEQRADRIHLTVEDWGIGFDQQRVRQDRFGLAGIRERAQLLGGQASIESVPGQGTRVTVDLPLVEADPNNSD
jgi:two-component system sensor histidine kinase UhpB